MSRSATSSESIFGYKEPRVDVLYGAATLTTYLGFSYAEKGTMHDLEGAKVRVTFVPS